MATKEIAWSKEAIQDRYKIYVFWLENNGNSNFSEKLELEFKNATKLLSFYPNIGKETDVEGVREKIVKSYKIFYRHTHKSILILRIWDTRQDPKKLII